MNGTEKMEVVEGPVKEIREWAEGKGADVILDQDNTTYYYNGKMNVPVGPACRFEVKNGEGKNAGKKEIISCKMITGNPANIAPAPVGQPQPLPGHMVSMPFPDFERIIGNKKAISESRVRALDAAAKVYAAMQPVVESPVSAAMDVIKIARRFESFLA